MSSSENKCPVDHATREIWLRNGGEGRHVSEPRNSAEKSKIPQTCSSETVDENQSSSTSCEGLSTEREVSSIPRHGAGKNWVYPSQSQFFNAMKRKNFDPNAKDMETIIPIHNAVNERAWMEILKWEQGLGGEKCNGPQLVKFQGDAKKLSPRARWNQMWGSQKPFDRHDWEIDRCGTRVEYVIDFYTGKANPLFPDMPSFYLDVRPKLNTVEGCRMRVAKFLGF